MTTDYTFRNPTMDITAKDSITNMLAKRTSAISLYRILLHWGGGETKNKILLTSYRVIITCNKQYYIH